MKFDEKTSNILSHLKKKGFITKLIGPVKEGKESVVYYSKDAEGNEIAIKIYLYEASMFKTLMKYVKPDTRFFSTKRRRRQSIINWVRKEFFNIKRTLNAGINNVPVPIKILENIFIMSFIGKNGLAAPLLKNYTFEDDKQTKDAFLACKKFIKDLYKKAGLVHADLSEYNILVEDGKLVFIDFSSALTKNSVEAINFLKKDVSNVFKFFKNKGVNTGSEELFVKSVIKNV